MINGLLKKIIIFAACAKILATNSKVKVRSRKLLLKPLRIVEATMLLPVCTTRSWTNRPGMGISR